MCCRWQWCTPCRQATWTRPRNTQTRLSCRLKSWRVSVPVLPVPLLQIVWSSVAECHSDMPSMLGVDLHTCFTCFLSKMQAVDLTLSKHSATQLASCQELPFLYLTVLVRKLAGSMDVRLYFSKYGHRASRKYANHDVNECEFVASEVSRRALMGSYRSLTCAYFKSFPGMKYTACPDWSKKFVKPMNIDFASKLYGC